MLGNYVHYFVMFSLSEAYEILSCDFLENTAAPALAGLWPASAPGGLRLAKAGAAAFSKKSHDKISYASLRVNMTK